MRRLIFLWLLVSMTGSLTSCLCHYRRYDQNDLEEQRKEDFKKETKEVSRNDAIGGSSSFLALPFYESDCKSSCISSKVDTKENRDTGTTYNNHEGTDYRTSEGSTVLAAADGVAYCKYHGSSESNLTVGGYGLYVIIDHQNGYYTKYAHLKKYEITCKSDGVKVLKGCKIAQSGKTGCPWGTFGCGAHLHFEVRKGSSTGTVIDPYSKQSGTYLFENDPPKPGSCSKGSIPQKAIDAIHHRLQSIRHKGRGSLGIHWYGGTSKRVVIQDIYSTEGGSCDAAVVFDDDGGARKAYLIKCGFWNYWSSRGGPDYKLGMPITEEYGNSTDIFQDFQNAYLSYRKSNGAIDIRYYRRATPGKKVGANWSGNLSYAFAEAYEHQGGRVGIGDASQPHGGSPEVHEWGGYWVQDFDYGKYGWCLLMHNSSKDEVFLIRTGFWRVYQQFNLINILGAPTGDESLPHPDVPQQRFEKGYLEYEKGKLKVCDYNGNKLHDVSTYCNRSAVIICLAKQKVCEGAVEKTCYDDGRGWTKKTCKCGCRNYACVGTICIPNQKICQNNTQKTCSSDGCKWSLRQCKSGCGKWTCREDVCIPNQEVCRDSKTQKTCKSDGTGWTEKNCLCGCKTWACITPCTPGQKLCQNGVQKTCNVDKCTWDEKKCDYGCGQWTCLPNPKPPSAPRCISGDKSCKDSKTLQICLTDGYAYREEKCSCGCENGQCKAQKCGPSSKVCKDEKTLTICTADGCGSYDFKCPCKCKNGSCEKEACYPGKTECKDGMTRRTCLTDGCGWKEEQCVCGCEGYGQCKAKACQANVTTCSSGIKKTCDSNGCNQKSETCKCDCLDTRNCKAAVCSPGQKKCIGGVESTCNQSGCSWQTKPCQNGCDGSSCKPPPSMICNPGEKKCLSTASLQTCSLDGLRISQQSCDCGCQNGSCQSRICQPSQTVCKDGRTKKTCSFNGCKWTETQCGCGCSSGTCTSKVCNLGATYCKDSQTKVTCQSSGCGWTEEKCGCGCSGGSCVQKVCTSGQILCQNGVLQECSGGCKWVTKQICTYGCDGNKCKIAPSTNPGQTSCTSGQTRCNGSIREVCNKNGQEWNFLEPCASGCQNGVCQNQVNSPQVTSAAVCYPSSRFCNNGNVQICMTDGSRWVQQYYCKNGCENGVCKNYSYQCTITFDPVTRKLSIAGTHDIKYFSSKCSIWTRADCWKDHVGLQVTIPAHHDFVHPRGDTNNGWPYLLVRACKFIGPHIWIERTNGGGIQLLK